MVSFFRHAFQRGSVCQVIPSHAFSNRTRAAPTQILQADCVSLRFNPKSVIAGSVFCLINDVVDSGSFSFWGQWTKLLCPNFLRDTLQSMIIMLRDKVGGEQMLPHTIAPVFKRNKEILQRCVKVSGRLVSISWRGAVWWTSQGRCSFEHISWIYYDDRLDRLDFNRCPAGQLGLGILSKVLSIAALREAKIKQHLH